MRQLRLHVRSRAPLVCSRTACAPRKATKKGADVTFPSPLSRCCHAAFASAGNEGPSCVVARPAVL